MSKDFIKVNGVVYRKVQDSRKVEDAPNTNERLESLAQGLGAKYNDKWRSYLHPFIVEYDKQRYLMKEKTRDQITFLDRVQFNLATSIGEVNFDGFAEQIQKIKIERIEKMVQDIHKFIAKMKRQKATTQEIEKGLDEIMRMTASDLKKELASISGKTKAMINDFEKKKKKFLK